MEEGGSERAREGRERRMFTSGLAPLSLVGGEKGVGGEKKRGGGVRSTHGPICGFIGGT